jgi:hypothetical protein
LAVEEDRTRRELLASPLLRLAWLRWRSSGSDNRCRVNTPGGRQNDPND